MSDPNNKGFIPPWMEKIAEQGGWKEAEKAMSAMAKIKPKAWKAIGETVGMLGEFIDKGVGFKDIGQDLQDSLSLTVAEALAPLTNQVDQAISEALAPIMPEITVFTNEIADWFSIAIGSWKSLITGEWDAVLDDISSKMPDWFKQLKNDLNEWWYDLWSGLFSGDATSLIDSVPLLPTGVGTGIDIGQAIVTAWTSFWAGLGWG